MQKYPHNYQVSATAGADTAVLLDSQGLKTLASFPPQQFDGPGDHWSPETLLVAALIDCFILTFRAIARASELTWFRLDCTADGLLDRVENITSFTRFDIKAVLTVPTGTDEHKAMRILHKAEAVCLISNSLNADRHLDARVEIAS